MAKEIKNNYNLKEFFGRIKFDVNQDLIIGQIPSLKFIIINRISITLWRDQLSQANMSQFTARNINYKMEICEKKILERISNSLEYIQIKCEVELKQWIKYFGHKLIHFLVPLNHFNYFTSLENFNNYWDNICFTQQGTINYVKTATQIIDKTSLSTIDKYILACHYCLEPKIRTLHKLLPTNFIESYDDVDNRLPLFWTFFIRGELENFSIYLNQLDIFDYLLLQAFQNENEVAVKYIWENFASDEMKELLNIYDAGNSEHDNMNTGLYFFQQMNEIQELEMDPDSINLLLKKLNIISKWRDVPPIDKYIFDIIRKYSIDIVLNIILYCWHRKIITMSQYVTIWDEVALYFKQDIAKDFDRICSNFFYFCLLKRYDILSIKLFINICSPENKKKILDQKAVKYCVQFMSIGGPELLDSFLNHVLEKEEKIFELKKKVFDEGSLELCVAVTANCKYEWIDNFLIDYVSQDKISEFKNNLPFKNNLDSIRCISERYVDYSFLSYSHLYKFDFLTALNNFLFWCFEGNEKEIERFKALVFDVDEVLYSDKRDMFFKVLHELVLDNNWELVENYMKWIFFASKDNQRSAKEKLTRIVKILNLISRKSNPHLSLRFIGYYELLKMFILCFQQDEVEELMEELKSDNYLLILVRELIKNVSYQKCNNLLEWLYSSDKVKIAEFKTHFLMDSVGCSYLYSLIKQDYNIKIIEALFEWFNPSQELMYLFRNRFNTFMMAEKKTMIEHFKMNNKTNEQFEEFWTPLKKRVEECLQILEKESH